MGCRPATAASAAHLWEDPMGTKLVALATAILASLTLSTAQAAEPKHGGILKVYHRETPPSLSIHEEATFSVNAPAMGLYNNLVVYDQHKPQNSMGTIVPDLATSWAWSADNLNMTFNLRAGIKSQVEVASLFVNAWPSCHLTPSRKLSVSFRLAGVQAQLVARSGTMEMHL